MEQFSLEEQETLKQYACILWESWMKWLAMSDVIVRSPGISLMGYDAYQDSCFPPEWTWTWAKHFVITSQTQLFFDNYKGKVIAVTGTKGKSTTSTLIYEVLKRVGLDVLLVWNIGDAFLSEVNFDHHYDYIVCELSSFQLCDVSINPAIAVITNLWIDHINFHGSVEEYHMAKMYIVGKDTEVCVHDSVNFPPSSFMKGRRHFVFGKSWEYRYDEKYFYVWKEKLYSCDDMRLLGDHNKENVCGVNSVCDLIGVDWGVVENVVKTFGWLPHRLEFVWEYAWIRWINDSQATSPSPTLVALDALGSEIGCIMLGGTDSWFDYREVVERIQYYNIGVVILFPDTIEQIRKLLTTSYEMLDAGPVILEAGSVEEAVGLAYKHCPHGKVCLLSPASKSFSICKNVYERGDLFREFVKKYVS